MFDNGTRFTPHVGTERLDVSNNARYTHLTCHLDDLVNRCDEANRIVRLIPYMASINTTIFSCDFSQGDHFGEFGVAPWGVKKSARKSKSPGVHANAHDIAHAVQFFRRSLAILHSYDSTAR